jgi:hypothetical protein
VTVSSVTLAPLFPLPVSHGTGLGFIGPGRKEKRIFECAMCRFMETVTEPDPLQSNSMQRLARELSEVFRGSNTFASKNSLVQNLTDSPVNAWSLIHPLVVELWWAEYRAFAVGRDGHSSGFELLICADDVEAIAQAQAVGRR